MAADRGAYIDQSQSLNIHMSEPNVGKITQYAFPWLEIGSQNRYVLSAYQSSSRRYSIHCRTERFR